MKLALTPPAAALCLQASPALAPGPSGHNDAGFNSEPNTHALAFLRIPIVASGARTGPVRSLEISRDPHDRDWLISLIRASRWVGIARWYPDSGFAPTGEYGPVLGGPDVQGPPG